MEKQQPKRRTNRLKFLYFILTVSVVLAGVSISGLLRERMSNDQAHSYYAALIDATPPRPTHPTSQEYIVETPPPWEPYLNFASVRETIPDLIAWIRCLDTVIDYPVVQTSDNDFYLTYLSNKTWNPNGAIFADYRNAADFSSPNTLIYGHHLKTGDMFSMLVRYREAGFYQDHPVFDLFTDEQDYRLELVAGFLIDPAKEVPPLLFANDEEFLDYVAACKARSNFVAEVEVLPEDKLVTLVTCDFVINDGRYIVVTKLLPVAP